MIPQPKPIRDYYNSVELGAVFEADGMKWIVQAIVTYIDEDLCTCIDIECREVTPLGLGRCTYFGYIYVFNAIQKYKSKHL